MYQRATPTLVLTPTPAPSGPATKGIHLNTLFCQVK